MNPRTYALTRWSLGVALLGVAASGLLGCEVVKSGKQDNLEFRLDTDDRLIPANFETPLAEGMEIDVLAFVNGSSGQVRAPVSNAASRSPGVARVRATRDNRMTIEGKAPGTAEISVTAAAGNDAFDIDVEAIDKVELSFPGVLLVPESAPVRVVQGGTARFGATLKGAQGRMLVGYGAFPVELSPATAGSVQATEDVAHLSVVFSELGAVTLTPRGDSPLEVTVVPPGDVTGLTLEATASTVEVEGSVLAVLRGTTDAGDKVVGLSGLATAQTSSEAICRITEAPKLGDAVFTVVGLSPGECRIEATFEALTAEALVTVTVR